MVKIVESFILVSIRWAQHYKTSGTTTGGLKDWKNQ